MLNFGGAALGSRKPVAGCLPSPPLHDLICVALWLLPATALIVTHGTAYPYIFGKAVFVRTIIEIILPVYVALILLSGRFVPSRNSLMWAVLTYGATTLTATALSQAPARSWWGTLERMDGAFANLHYVALFLILVGVLRSWSDWKALFFAWIAVDLLVSVEGVREYFGGVDRVGSTVGYSSFAATFALFAVFFGVCLMCWNKRTHWQESYGILGLVSALILLWLSRTRGAFVGLAAGLLVALVLVLVYRRQWRRRAGAVLFLLAATPAGIRLARDSALARWSPTIGRLSEISPSDPTTRTRLLMLGVSWNAFKDHPIFGCGPELLVHAYSLHYDPKLLLNKPAWFDHAHYNPKLLVNKPAWFDHAHDMLADVAVMEGMMGLTAYLGIFVAAGALLFRALQRPDPQFWVIASTFGMLAAYFVQNLFLFDEPVSYLLFYTLLAFVSFLAEQGKPSTTRPRATASRLEGKPIRNLSRPGWVTVGGAAAVMMFSLYECNLAPLLQARAAGRLADSLGDPDTFLENFRRMLWWRKWPTSQLVEVAADELIKSGVTNNPLFRNAGTEVAAAMERSASGHVEPDARFFLRLGVLNYQLAFTDPSRLGPSEAALKTAIRLAPRLPQVYVALGLNYLQAGKTDEGLRSLRHAVELNPQSEMGQSYILVLEGVVKDCLRVGNFTVATTSQKELVTLDPANAQRHAALAQIYMDSGNLMGALQEFNTAATLDPTYSRRAMDVAKLVDRARATSQRTGTVPRMSQSTVGTGVR